STRQSAPVASPATSHRAGCSSRSSATSPTASSSAPHSADGSRARVASRESSGVESTRASCPAGARPGCVVLRRGRAMATQGRRPLPPGDDDLAQELKLHLQTLHDLGPSYSDEVAEAFIRHIDQRIDQRLERRLAQMSAQRGHDTGAIVWTLVLAIPITAIV